MDFSLREDTHPAESSSEDEETNNLLDNLDDSDEEIQIWDTDKTGERVLNAKKSYGMKVVEDRIGFKIRLDDQYYNQFA